jgi:hypothetical protein
MRIDMWKEVVVAYFRYYLSISMERLGKTTKTSVMIVGIEWRLEPGAYRKIRIMLITRLQLSMSPSNAIDDCYFVCLDLSRRMLGR